MTNINPPLMLYILTVHFPIHSFIIIYTCHYSSESILLKNHVFCIFQCVQNYPIGVIKFINCISNHFFLGYLFCRKFCKVKRKKEWLCACIWQCELLHNRNKEKDNLLKGVGLTALSKQTEKCAKVMHHFT